MCVCVHPKVASFPVSTLIPSFFFAPWKISKKKAGELVEAGNEASPKVNSLLC